MIVLGLHLGSLFNLLEVESWPVVGVLILLLNLDCEARPIVIKSLLELPIFVIYRLT